MKSTRKLSRTLLAVGLVFLLTLTSGGHAVAQGCVQTPSGLVSWWPLDGNADDIQDGNPATLFGGPGFATGHVGQALQLDGLDDYAMVPEASNLNVGDSSGLTIEGWINPSSVSIPGGQPIVEWSAGTGDTYPGLHLWIGTISPGDIFVNLVSDSATDHVITTNANVLSANTWQHVALTYDKTTGIARLYVNGFTATEQFLGTFTPKTSEHLWFGYRPPSTTATIHRYAGALDELGVYNRTLSPMEIQDIFNAGSAGKCNGVVPFAAFTAKVVKVGWGPLASDDSFDVRGTFTLGASSNGINLLTEARHLQLGTFSIMNVEINPLGGNTFSFKAVGSNADLIGTFIPLTIRLTIGDDNGSITLAQGTANFK